MKAETKGVCEINFMGHQLISAIESYFGTQEMNNLSLYFISAHQKIDLISYLLSKNWTILIVGIECEGWAICNLIMHECFYYLVYICRLSHYIYPSIDFTSSYNVQLSLRFTASMELHLLPILTCLSVRLHFYLSFVFIFLT